MKVSVSSPENLPFEYWISPSSEKEIKAADVSKNNNISNTVALIISSLNKYFPELQYSSDNKFIGFQNEITKILLKQKRKNN